ncbi:SH2 domain-containing protein 4A isoform X2 [Rhipicephalus microplus]|uniref:SH2 domain-containing protein 4A isoform X2 n=2 Tax=Rhipicephalus microplus TaxID=6941 RepID=UPI0018878A62|nr:SH2 domain-containing protein 4A-like isoform X1 [Rhipicephalus microplus]
MIVITHFGKPMTRKKGVKMLQQILRDMYIDPQLLAELDDEQKHILFCKMREEQVRRWEQREKELALNNKKNGTNSNSNKPGSKRVDFLLGSDGKPWTWVMGEHPEDSTIEEILEKETKEKARIQAAQEALQLRNQEEQQQKQQQQRQEQQQQEQLWQQQQQQQQQQPQQQQQKEIVVVPTTPSPPPDIPKDCIEEVVRLRRKKKPLEGCFSLEKEVAALLQDSVVATSRVSTVDRSMWLSQKQQEIKNREESLKQLMEQRSQEIYQEIKAQQRKSFEAAERESMVQEEFWIEQEKKAKEVEKQIREIARIAREEHKRALHLGNGKTLASVDMREPVMSLNGKPPVPPKVVPPTLPATPPPNLVMNGTSNGSIKNGITTITTTTTGSPTTVMPSHATSRSKDAELFSRADIIQWFLKEEYPRGAVTDHNGNNLAAWFHGFIGRPESEQLLQRHGGAAAGAFLVRVHERIKGYVISYWAGDRCKHYLIDASLGHCQFFGSNQLVFPRLKDLILHHTTNPITALGQEQLLDPCPRNNSNNLFSLLPTLGQ